MLVPNFYPIGCTTIAAGQIMRYHEHPQLYSWNLMPYNTPNNHTAEFLYDLANTFNVKFSANGSPAELKDVVSGIKNFGYIVIEKDHDPYSVEKDIKQGKPVLMYGNSIESAHMWVCDGISSSNSGTEIRIMTIEYRPTTYNEPDKMVEAFRKTLKLVISPTAYRMNWGWGGTCDGYYLDDNIKVSIDDNTIRDYNYNRRDYFLTPHK